MTKPIELLLQAIYSPGDLARLDRVRRSSSDILIALEEVDEPLDYGDMSRSEKGREWIAQVYMSLAEDDEDASADTSIAVAMEELRTSEARQVGEAFAQLCSTLPRLSRWRHYFPSLSGYGFEEYLAQDESIGASGEYGGQLVGIGLTPTMFFGATRSMQLMFDRAHRALRGRADSTSLRRWGELGPASLNLKFDGEVIGVPQVALSQQVAGVKNLPTGAAEPMVRWTLDALMDRPFLVAGYQYELESRTFEPHSMPWDVEPNALMARWGCQRPPD